MKTQLLKAFATIAVLIAGAPSVKSRKIIMRLETV